MSHPLLKQIRCKCCARIFYVCQHCWRGQVYCSAVCRREFQRRAHCRAQQKYRRTAKGKKRHQQAERRRRMRQGKKTMDDTPSTAAADCATVRANRLVCCRFCGQSGPIVDHFPRRGYAGTYLDRISGCRVI